jgi:hypothetical protein
MTVSFPKFLRSEDKRYKLTLDNEEKILRMREGGDTYQYIADTFKVSFHTVYYLCQRRFNPEIWEKRKEVKRVAQAKIRIKIPITKVRSDSMKQRKRQIEIKGESYRVYDRVRNLERYKEKKEEINPRRNKRRRELYKLKKQKNV